MATKYELTWQPDKLRWRKIYKGRLHQVTCTELGVPGNKESSYPAARRWWQARRAEIDAAEALAHPHAATLAELSRREAWARRAGQEVEAANLEVERRRVESGGEPADPHELLRDAWRAMFGTEPPDAERLRELFGTEATWRDRVGRPEAVEADRTVGAKIEEYLAAERARHDAGEVSASEFDLARRCLKRFGAWAGESGPVGGLDGAKLEGWWLHLLRLQVSRDLKLKLLRYARQFYAWLAGLDLIVPPTNLYSRRHRFRAEDRELVTVPVGEVKGVIEGARPPLRLYLLLMVNCGYTQQDAADLRPDQVDWGSGRIRRKRSKTAANPAVPTVDYPLWPATFELLRRHRQPEGDRVLLTSAGRPLVHDRLTESGARSKTDSVRLTFERYRRSAKFSWSLKALRKTSATLLGEHPEFGRYTQYFLGHAPGTMADKHYVVPSQDRFDAAVAWLGERYGLSPAV